MRIILASKSPRRRELLSELYQDFDIVVAECDESLGELSAYEGVRILAKKKGSAALSLLRSESLPCESADSALIISSDTLVECDGVPLGKPSDESESRRMLRMLSGRGHNVHTGVAVHYGGACLSGVATTEVIFKELTDAEIDEYIATGEPFDKAGSYGIQGEAGKFVREIRGDLDTVIGLSLALTRRLISQITGGRKE